MKQQCKALPLISLLIVLLSFASAPTVNAQPYDYSYLEIVGEAYVSSPKEARCRYSVTIKNVQVKSLGTWTLNLYGRPDSIYSVDRVLDESGSLNYEYLKGDPGSFPQIKVTFRRAISPGETYQFSYEYATKLAYNGYSWQVGWSTSRIIEKIKLKISVSDQMKIIRTYPAGAYSDDRKSAETEATNVKTAYLLALYPPTTGKQSILAVLAEFKDIKHTIGREEISRKLFQDMNSYFKQVSFNQISIVGDTTDWIMLSKTASSYNIAAWGSTDQNRKAFEEEVIKAADDIVDYSRYVTVIIVTSGVYHQTV